MILIAVGVENGQNWCIMLHASQVEIEESKKNKRSPQQKGYERQTLISSLT